MRTVKPITTDDWNNYEWLNDGIDALCIRGVKKTLPPNDGYHYIEVTQFADSERKWSRALEVIKD